MDADATPTAIASLLLGDVRERVAAKMSLMADLRVKIEAAKHTLAQKPRGLAAEVARNTLWDLKRELAHEETLLEQLYSDEEVASLQLWAAERSFSLPWAGRGAGPLTVQEQALIWQAGAQQQPPFSVAAIASALGRADSTVRSMLRQLHEQLQAEIAQLHQQLQLQALPLDCDPQDPALQDIHAWAQQQLAAVINN